MKELGTGSQFEVKCEPVPNSVPIHLYGSMKEKLSCCQRAMHLPQERRVLALASQAGRSMK